MTPKLKRGIPKRKPNYYDMKWIDRRWGKDNEPTGIITTEQPEKGTADLMAEGIMAGIGFAFLLLILWLIADALVIWLTPYPSLHYYLFR